MSGVLQNGFNKWCVIRTSSRLHLTLIGMHRGVYRRNGGIGFAIASPSLDVRCQRARHLEISDSRARPFQQAELERIRSILVEIPFIAASPELSFEISGDAPSHFGFGTGTSIRLACVEAAAKVLGMKLDASQIIACSRRGGTSGIGINTYFEGGFVFDLGTKSDANPHVSSSSAESVRPKTSLILTKNPMPAWRIGICIPQFLSGLTQSEESAFFQRTCPIQEDEVREILYHVTYGIAAAVLEADFGKFCEALNRLQHTAWKRAEWHVHGEKLEELAEEIRNAGAECVAMSSLGPSLFFLGRNVPEVLERLIRQNPRCVWMSTQPSNNGRTVTNG